MSSEGGGKRTNVKIRIPPTYIGAEFFARDYKKPEGLARLMVFFFGDWPPPYNHYRVVNKYQDEFILIKNGCRYHHFTREEIIKMQDCD